MIQKLPLLYKHITPKRLSFNLSFCEGVDLKVLLEKKQPQKGDNMVLAVDIDFYVYIYMYIYT